jgi:deoxyribose-phosphate aldolase
MMDKRDLAALIDHTLLKAEATSEDIRTHCREARTYRFCCVCVNPIHVRLARQELAGTTVKVCTVAGFPLGATTPEIKAFEATAGIRDGAQEIDMVLNIGAMRDGNHDLVERDVRAVVNACAGKALVKVIFETCLLDKVEIAEACRICQRAGADFVKTSTGLNKAGATVEDVRLMRQVVGPGMGVKAAGGIRDLATAMAMIKAGANRIGSSASVAIVSDAE